MKNLPEYTCDPFSTEQYGPWELLADDGETVLNTIVAIECDANYISRYFSVTNMYPPNINITCRMRWDHPLLNPVEPEEPPVDPEPEEPVQSGD